MHTSCDLLDVNILLERISTDLKAHLERNHIKSAYMVGIHTGGVWIAEHLHQQLNLKTQLGQLDISFYRDDFSQIGLHPHVTPTALPFEVDDEHIILVDDVLQSGRTIRAALNELFDYGRPASVTLAVLIERVGRELPIQADVSGCSLPLSPQQYLRLSGPKPLKLTIQQKKTN